MDVKVSLEDLLSRIEIIYVPVEEIARFQKKIETDVKLVGSKNVLLLE